MGYDSSKHLVGREAREVEIEAEGDTFTIKVRSVPWSRKNQLVSLALKWDAGGNTQFDGDQYIRECLKYMIVEAPWGATTDVFLSQVGDELGSALEALVPKAFGGKEKKAPSPDDIKKE